VKKLAEVAVGAGVVGGLMCGLPLALLLLYSML
jgi:hypothetical protein